MKEKDTDAAGAGPSRQVFAGRKGRLLGLAGGLTLLLCYLPFHKASAREPYSGTWTGNFNSEKGSQLALRLRTRSGGDDYRYLSVALSKLEGLSREAATGPSAADIKFSLRREAGALLFEGSSRKGAGSGRFTFAPDPAFAGTLKTLGYDDIELKDQFAMALHDINSAVIREVRERRGGKLSRNQLLHLAWSGLDEDAMKETKQTDAAQPHVAPRVKATSHAGSGGDLTEQLVARGYAAPSAAQLAALREHGVTLSFIEELKALGYDKPSLDQLIALRRNGVVPAYVSEVKALGYADISLDDVAKLREEGINLGFVRELVGKGYELPSVSQLMAMQTQGVTPAYVRDVEAMGYRGLTPKQLVCMRIQGVTSEFMAQVRAGGRKVSVRELVRLKNPGAKFEGACALEVFPDDVPE